MRKSLLVIVAVALVTLGVVSFVLANQSAKSTTSSPTSGSTSSSTTLIVSNGEKPLLLYNAEGKFTVLGHYQSDSAYSMAEAYTPDASLFVSPFLWNMKHADGYVNLTYVGPTLNVVVNVTHFQKVNPSIPVDGYPGVMYGQEDWFPFAGHTEEYLLYLPEPVTALPQVESCLNYSLWVKVGSIQDFSYDIWLTQDPNTTYLQYPDVEVMIWLYHQEEISSSYYVKEGEFSVEGVVNGTPENLTFSVYVLPHTGSSNGWIGVYFVSQSQLEGKVDLPLTQFLQGSFPYIEKVFNSLNEGGYYLDGIQVGMEFNDDNGTAVMGYSLYNWTITVS